MDGIKYWSQLDILPTFDSQGEGSIDLVLGKSKVLGPTMRRDHELFLEPDTRGDQDDLADFISFSMQTQHELALNSQVHYP
jgi:hypothetical protein